MPGEQEERMSDGAYSDGSGTPKPGDSVARWKILSAPVWDGNAAISGPDVDDPIEVVPLAALQTASARVQELEGELARGELSWKIAWQAQADEKAQREASESRLAQLEKALKEIAESTVFAGGPLRSIARSALTHTTPEEKGASG